jgi:phosphoribosylformylglycinamidine synthase
MFTEFFARKDTFSLGVCNGCQMMSQLRGIIPGAAAWPRFERNVSSRFEARLCMVEIEDSPSLFFAGHGWSAGCRLWWRMAKGHAGDCGRGCGDGGAVYRHVWAR